MLHGIETTVGWSTRPESSLAGSEAAERAREKLSSRTGHQLAFAFASSWYEQDSLLRGVRGILDRAMVFGGSTAGEITPDGPISHGCVVLVLSAEEIHWGLGFGQDMDSEPRRAGQQAAYLASRAFPSSQRSAFLMFGDGLMTSYSAVATGVQEVLGTNAFIVGALAGDDLRFSETTQYCNEHAATNAVAGMLIGGPLRLGVGIDHGFAPISKPRQITRAYDNVLVEIDRKPAAVVYEEYFGPALVSRIRADRLTRPGMAYPLGIQEAGSSQWLLRNVVAFQQDGSLWCNGEVKEGSWMQLMLCNRGLVLESVRRAAERAVSSLDHVACVLVFSSYVRQRVLGATFAGAELATIRQTIGPAVPVAGCYTYGELAPTATPPDPGMPAVHTGSVLVIGVGV
ncbi:MAG TPA: FIST N-terminal domain-containing protein [bacterium]